jgi:hydroxyacylglutathione hydrolase
MLDIQTLQVTVFEQNCRILIDTATNEGVVVDPGGESEKIISAIEKTGCNVVGVWLTHSHLDHCGAVAPLLARYPAPLVGTEDEREMRRSVCTIAAMYGLEPEQWPNCPEPDRYVVDGDEVFVGKYRAEIMYTPGHSPGHISFHFADSGVVLAGDALFRESIGRTDLPGGNHEQLLVSIRERLFTLPDDTRVLSGHGPETTIGYERIHNPFLA